MTETETTKEEAKEEPKVEKEEPKKEELKEEKEEPKKEESKERKKELKEQEKIPSPSPPKTGNEFSDFEKKIVII